MTNSEMQDNPADTIRAAFEHLLISTTRSQRLDWIAATTKQVPRQQVFVADDSSLDDIFNSDCEWITLSDQVYIYPMVYFSTIITQLTTGGPIVQSIQV